MSSSSSSSSNRGFKFSYDFKTVFLSCAATAFAVMAYLVLFDVFGMGQEYRFAGILFGVSFIVILLSVVFSLVNLYVFRDICKALDKAE